MRWCHALPRADVSFCLLCVPSSLQKRVTPDTVPGEFITYLNDIEAFGVRTEAAKQQLVQHFRKCNKDVQVDASMLSWLRKEFHDFSNAVMQLAQKVRGIVAATSPPAGRTSCR